MTSREAKRIALSNIVTAIEGDIGTGAAYRQAHPETLAGMTDAEVAEVAAATEAILDVLRRRAKRLTSYFSAPRTSRRP